MKHFYLSLLVLISGTLFSQKLKIYKPGQQPAKYENACILLKNGDRSLDYLSKLEDFSGFLVVKISGFNESGFSIDSISKIISSVLSPTAIIFENTDLSALNGTLENFKSLKEITVLGDCGVDENMLFHLLKKNSVSRLYLQKNEAELITDSLSLVKSLKNVQLSNSDKFTVVNRTEDVQFIAGGNLNHLALAYCGNFYKTEKNNIKTSPEINSAPATVGKKKFVNPYTFIKQPVPGVKINDTTYTFNSGSFSSFKYQSGSVISIDKDAFVYLDGTPYKGKVELFYREFRNPVEIMLSGIPMTSVDKDTVRLFKSAGMYEIYAKDKAGNELKTTTETAVQVNFAVTDTSGDYKFYSLNTGGGWSTKSDKVAINTTAAPGTLKPSKAVNEYFKYYYRNLNKRKADTTRYESRFYDFQYIQKYRVDNLISKRGKYDYPNDFFHPDVRTRGLLKIKIKGVTKDQKILFTFVPVKEKLLDNFPKHLRPLLNRMYIYKGDLDRNGFSAKYCLQKYYWDCKVEENNEVLSLELKTISTIESLTAQAIFLKADKSYEVLKRSNRVLAKKSNLAYHREAKVFNKRGRNSVNEHNDLFKKKRNDRSAIKQEAYDFCKKYHTPGEAKIAYTGWEAYAFKRNPGFNHGGFMEETPVGNALVTSGMGVYNIDEYIHTGKMEEIYVKYEGAKMDTVSSQYNAMLFATINTTYPMYSTSFTNKNLKGYYYKNEPNYVIRFTSEGMMQVVKPMELAVVKKGRHIEAPFNNQYSIKGLNSTEITKLIFE